MAYFNYEGKKVYYDEAGRGEPLLLLHGNSVSSKMFASEIEYYSQFFRVIYFDYPGHGLSERLDRFPDRFWLYNAGAAIEFLNLLNIKKTRIIGTSGGALVALNLAEMQPDIPVKIIADSFFGNYITAEEAYRIKKNRTKAKNEILASAFWKYMHGDEWSNIVDNDLDMLVRAGESGEPLIHGDLSQVKCPVLATASYEDELIPGIAERITDVIRQLPDATSVFSHEGKHPFMITKKEEFRQIAMDFLK